MNSALVGESMQLVEEYAEQMRQIAQLIDRSKTDLDRQSKEKPNQQSGELSASLLFWIKKALKISNKDKLPGEEDFFSAMERLILETNCSSQTDLRSAQRELEKLKPSEWFYVLWRLVQSGCAEDVQEFLNLASSCKVSIDPHCFQGTFFMPPRLDSLCKYNAIRHMILQSCGCENYCQIVLKAFKV